jgi:uncharacterized C2H2 Zn-finger protein
MILGKANLLTELKPWNSWNRHTGIRKASGDFDGRIASSEVEVDFSKFKTDEYLFSWVTAIAGIEVESDDHTIVAPHNKWINENGNAWKNEVVLESYHSFILAENYLEHIQIPALSKGKVLDAVAWVVHKQYNGYKEPVPTIFVDCLLATNKKKHKSLCDNILNGTIDTTSMGCSIEWTQCSRCGKYFEEDKDRFCRHIEDDLGRSYTDKKGIKRKVAELCGRQGYPDSCIFKELSWVRRPAFYPAKKHGFVEVSKKSTGKKMRAFVPSERMEEASEE